MRSTLACRNSTYLDRSEEHTSELQSLTNLVCRLLLVKKTIHRLQTLTRRRNPVNCLTSRLVRQPRDDTSRECREQRTHRRVGIMIMSYSRTVALAVHH